MSGTPNTTWVKRPHSRVCVVLLFSMEHSPCAITLIHQASRALCSHGTSFGCYRQGNQSMAWVLNCRGSFRCGGAQSPQFPCGYPPTTPRALYTCSCDGREQHMSEEVSPSPTCAFPLRANASRRRQRHSRCSPDRRAPDARPLPSLANAGVVARIPVLPSLLVPCCPHSGTTFVFQCLTWAFHPERVCGKQALKHGGPPSLAHYSDAWGSAACGSRRFLLPALHGGLLGGFAPTKELFYFGGGFGRDDGGGFGRDGWGKLTGVPLPLCYWEKGFQTALNGRPTADKLANNHRLCRSRPSSSSTACTHVACEEQLTTGEPSGVRPDAGMRREALMAPKARPKPSGELLISSSLPRVRPSELAGAVVTDMTPNYLCSPASLRSLTRSLGTPAHFRMLLVMRSGLGTFQANCRMFAHWKGNPNPTPNPGTLQASYRMFTHWKWIRSSAVSFDKFVRSQLDRLRNCNRTLYDRPESILVAPPHEVRTYFDRCFRGTWQDSLHVVLPNVCVRAYAAAASTRRLPPIHLPIHLPIPDGISLYLRRVHTFCSHLPN